MPSKSPIPQPQKTSGNTGAKSDKRGELGAKDLDKVVGGMRAGRGKKTDDPCGGDE